jgi:hypothetical protein
MASSEGAASLGATSLKANSLMLGTTLGARGLPSSVALLEPAGALACGVSRQGGGSVSAGRVVGVCQQAAALCCFAKLQKYGKQQGV